MLEGSVRKAGGRVRITGRNRRRAALASFFVCARVRGYPRGQSALLAARGSGSSIGRDDPMNPSRVGLDAFNSALHADNLAQRVDDLHEIALRRHDGVDILIR